MRLLELGGVASRAELAGVDDAALAGALAAGSVVRVARGRFALPGADAAAVAARRVTGVVVGLSAAQLHGWKVRLPPPRPTVAVPRNRSRVPGVRRVDVPPHRIVRRRGAPVLDRTWTVLDCARTLPFDDALCVADSALRQDGLDRGDLLAALAELPRTGRPAAREVIERADLRAANPFESAARAIACRVRGLHVEPQVRIDDIGWVDLADVRLRLVVECESAQFHEGKEAFERDVRRYTRLTIRGWLVVRLLWKDVLFSPLLVEQWLTAAVAERRAHSSYGGRLGPA